MSTMSSLHRLLWNREVEKFSRYSRCSTWQIIYFHVEWRRAENSKYEQLKVSPALDLGIVFNMAAI